MALLEIKLRIIIKVLIKKNIYSDFIKIVCNQKKKLITKDNDLNKINKIKLLSKLIVNQ